MKKLIIIAFVLGVLIGGLVSYAHYHSYTTGDLNHDGAVDEADLSILLSHRTN